MKKSLILLFLMLMTSQVFHAQTFDKLWKDVEVAKKKDLPQSQINLLDKISQKAEREKNYGQLLSAQLLKVQLRTSISPDSAKVELSKLQKKAEQYDGKNEVLSALYATVLGSLVSADNPKQSEAYFKKALANPTLLAKQKAIDFQPLILKGKDDNMFNNDLLHVIGMQAEHYKDLEQFYAAQGNREAACYMALLDITKSDEPSSETLDSLLQVYGDLPIAGEVAVSRYETFGSKVSAKDKINFIDNALAHWGSWPKMAALRNARAQLISPYFNAQILDGLVTSDDAENKVKLRLRNLSKVKLTIIPTTLNGGDKSFGGYNFISGDIDAEKIRPYLSMTGRQEIVRNYSNYQDYEELEDSFDLPKLPLGVYLIKSESNNPKIEADYRLYAVSNLYYLAEDQPGNQLRVVVVNSKTGKPIAGAQVRLSFREKYGKAAPSKTLVTNNKGEAIYAYGNDKPIDIYVSTAGDKALPISSVWASFYASKPGEKTTITSIFTDRQVYRPGQTVHVSAIAYIRNNKELTTKALTDKSFDLVLYNANSKEIGRRTVTTDKYGTVATDFVLPTDGLTGTFLVSASLGSNGQARFRVEEYKRPTFEVTFDDYKEKYASGDTITLIGHAKSYTGMPIQGGKVYYKAVRRSSWWLRYMDLEDETILNGETITDGEGNFRVRLPLLLPEKKSAKQLIDFYDFELRASVTDVAGETQEAKVTLPLSLKAGSLNVDLPEKQLRDDFKALQFSFINASGKAVEGDVSYEIIPQSDYRADYVYTRLAKVKANSPIAVKALPSGAYHLHAICEGDTLDRDFILFSLDDKQPVVKTSDWYYLSASTFPRDGAPVYLQVGTSEKEQHVVYSIYAGTKILETGSFVLDNAIQTRKLTYKPEYGDGITINYAWVRNGKLYSHTATIARPLPDKRLLIKWDTFRNKLTPGQKETWTLTINKPDGKAANAQLMATLYDKSLEQIVKHTWDFEPNFRLTRVTTAWNGMLDWGLLLSGYTDEKLEEVKNLDFSTFDSKFFIDFDNYFMMPLANSTRNVMIRGTKLMATPMAAVTYDMAADSEAGLAVSEDNVGSKRMYKEATTNRPTVSIRTNLGETAFFYPQLQTDGKGQVSLKFTLPETLTTWRLMGLAHDVDMNYGTISEDIVAQKTLMIQPNMPRFLRQGDKATLSARLSNQSDHAIKALARLTIIDPMTEKVIEEQEIEQVLAAKGTGVATYDLATLLSENGKLSPEQSLLVVKLTVEGDGNTDGEQQYLAVLPNKEYVTNTQAFSINKPENKTIDVAKLFPKDASQAKLTVEYTNNPSWLMVQSLPYVGSVNEKDAISLVSAYYANLLGKHILSQSDDIKKVIEQWKREQGKQSPLRSALEQNQELKTLALNDTPWLMAADNEREQKQMLSQFFDDNQLSYRLSRTFNALKKLQNPDGSFSWWEGMAGSEYMTTAVVKTLSRLQTLVGRSPEMSSMLDAAFRFLDIKAAKRVEQMKEDERKYKISVFPTNDLCDYLYASALINRTKTSVMSYLVDRLSKETKHLSIYGKANIAVILHQYGKSELARQYLKSLKEYSVYTEEMGRYFDTRKALYSWFDYKIPTEVAAIEALKAITPNDKQTITEMQRWLLQSKRTQLWDTPLNAVNAIWAFTNNGNWQMTTGTSAHISLDNESIYKPSRTSGLGYVSIVKPLDKSQETPKTLTIEKSNEGVSWGAVYAQFFQKASNISSAASGLKVKREVLLGNEVIKDGQLLKVGDRVRIRITLTADRDYDFVQVVDKRAASLSVVNQLSGYQGEYYLSPKDYTTNYYFDSMRKGQHVIETEYFIDRAGEYHSGTCTAQCAYAPEFSGRASALTVVSE